MTARSRHPQIGDLIIYNYKAITDYAGLVKKIEYDRRGYANNVYIQWQGDVPPVYNNGCGFSGLNIHNLPHEFRVIRDGIDVQ